MNNTELQELADWLGGDLFHTKSDTYVQVSTGDNTSKENYDDLIGMRSDMEHILNEFEITDLWADHDTQIVTLDKKQL